MCLLSVWLVRWLFYKNDYDVLLSTLQPLSPNSPIVLSRIKPRREHDPVDFQTRDSMHLLKVIIAIILLQVLSLMECWTMKLNELGQSVLYSAKNLNAPNV
jgi:hypothetical protein